MGFEWCKIDQAKRTLLQYQDLIKIRLSSLALNRQVIAYTLISLQLNPALRTPHHYGQFALFLGKESPYIFSKFIPLNTDTSCSPPPLPLNVLRCIRSPLFQRLSKITRLRSLCISYKLNKQGSFMALFIIQVQYLQASVTYCKYIFQKFSIYINRSKLFKKFCTLSHHIT